MNAVYMSSFRDTVVNILKCHQNYMKSLTMTWLLNIAARRPLWQLLFLPIKHVLKKEINYIFDLIIFFIFFFFHAVLFQYIST